MLQRLEDLEILETLDETHGGSTQIVIGRHNQQLIVCKSIQKGSLKDTKSIEHIKNEKQALLHFTDVKARGVSQLIHTFQDQKRLHIILEPVRGLPLHKLLKMVELLNPAFTFLIVTQIGLILQNFHQNGYIYRDIKASNFIVDEKGRVTMIDLGLAKKIDKDRTFTICGTVHAMPPEIYQTEGYSYQFDYYSFGILIFELLTGKAPFGYSNSNNHIREEMKKGISEEQLAVIKCQETRDLIFKLLASPSVRLGAKKGFEQILEHDYFNVPEFCTAKDIYDGEEDLDASNPDFQLYVSEISDFGIQDFKFEKILPSDPFYKFCN